MDFLGQKLQKPGVKLALNESALLLQNRMSCASYVSKDGEPIAPHLLHDDGLKRDTSRKFVKRGKKEGVLQINETCLENLKRDPSDWPTL